jgi:hypothetical protein
MLKKIMNWYNSNAYAHSFVNGLEGAVVGALSSWGGGVPASKGAWITLAAFVGKAAWGWWKRWAAQNVATTPVPQGPAQLPAVKEAIKS